MAEHTSRLTMTITILLVLAFIIFVFLVIGIIVCAKIRKKTEAGNKKEVFSCKNQKKKPTFAGS